MADQTQTLTLSAVPDSGTCDLTVGDCLLSGVTPANLATPSQIVTLLAAASRIFASGVAAAVSGLVDTFTFGSPVGNYDWPVIGVSNNSLSIPNSGNGLTKVYSGQPSNVLGLTFTPGSGGNTFNLNDGTTDYPLADNMTAADIATAVAGLGGFGGVTDSTGNGSGSVQPYFITTDGSGTYSIDSDTGAGAAVTAGVQERWDLSLGSPTPNTGTFSIQDADGNTTGPINLPGTGTTVGDAISALPDVSAAGGATSTGASPIQIVYSQVGAQTGLSFTDNGLGTGVTLTVAITVHGSQPAAMSPLGPLIARRAYRL